MVAITPARNIKLTIAYDGTAYHGFQRQNNALSIQEILETKLQKIFGHPIKINGAARTDAGVHAYGQVINLHTTGKIPTQNIMRATLGVLPDDIVITEAQEMPADFHARRKAIAKEYLYRIYHNPIPNPFNLKYAWHIKKPMSIQAMQEAAQTLVGTHDYASFKALGSSAKTSVRTIHTIDIQKTGDFIDMRITGNGFLYHMVRNIMGTLVPIGCGNRPSSDMINILAAKSRHAAGPTAPAHGLYLVKVDYR